MSRYYAIVLTGVLASGVLGCGGGPSGPPKVPVHSVTGKVTVDGKALTGCIILFSTSNPAVGAQGGYSGELDGEGSYTLTDADGNPGAAPGKYKISFILPPEAAKEAMMKGGGQPGSSAGPFPKEYGSTETSPKEVDVKAEDNVVDIAI